MCKTNIPDALKTTRAKNRISSTKFVSIPKPTGEVIEHDCAKSATVIGLMIGTRDGATVSKENIRICEHCFSPVDATGAVNADGCPNTHGQRLLKKGIDVEFVPTPTWLERGCHSKRVSIAEIIAAG